MDQAIMDAPARKHSEVLNEHLEIKGAAIADIGCGDGSLTRALTHYGGRVVGLDPSGNQLERARAADAVGEEHYIEAGAEALPLDDSSLDIAIFFNALHHVPVASMDKALEEAARTLKPGGQLYVVEPLADGAWYRLIRPVDDEKEVRAEAYAALKRAAESKAFDPAAETVYRWHNDIKDFEDLKARVLNVDESRAERFAAHEADLREAFETAGDEILEDGRKRFWQPYRMNLLTRAS